MVTKSIVLIFDPFAAESPPAETARLGEQTTADPFCFVHSPKSVADPVDEIVIAQITFVVDAAVAPPNVKPLVAFPPVAPASVLAAPVISPKSCAFPLVAISKYSIIVFLPGAPPPQNIL